MLPERPPSSFAAAALAAAAAALAAAPASGQGAAAIMDTALARYEARMEGIHTYRVRQTTMGFTTTSSFVKRTVDGHPVFVRSGRENDAGRMPRGWGNPYRLFPTLAERAELAGRTRVDGHPTWHVVVSDFRGLRLEGMTPDPAAGRFRPQRLELFLDVRSHVLRRLRLRGKMVADTSSRALAMDAGFHDYRDVEGMLHPFRLTLTVRGMTAAIPRERLERARRQLERARARLKQRPDSRRGTTRQRLEARLEQLRRMLESGVFETEVSVEEVVVNGGASAGNGG